MPHQAAFARMNAQIDAAHASDTLRKAKREQAKAARLVSLAFAAGAVPTEADMDALLAKVDINGNNIPDPSDFTDFGNDYAAVTPYYHLRPTNLAAQVVGQQVNLSWSNGATVPESILIFRNGILIQTLQGSPTTYTDSPGDGTHSWLIRATLTSYPPSKPSNTVTATIGVVTPPVSGWTQFHPEAEFYVSQSGNDSNAGTQVAPFRTFQKAYDSLRPGRRDWFYLKAGETYNLDSFHWGKSAGQSDYMGVGVWGATPAAPRALIRSPQAAIYMGTTPNGQGIAFVGLDIRPNAPTSGCAAITLFELWKDILVEDCALIGFPVNLVAQEITQPNRINGLKLRRCIFADSIETGGGHSQGAFTGSVDQMLIEECVFDRNATNRADVFCHDWYGSETCGVVTWTGNTFARATSHGYQCRAGGTGRWNLSLNNPINGFVGNSAGQPGIFTDNCAIDSRDISPGNGRGFGFVLSGTLEISRNVVAGQRSGTDAVIAYDLDGLNSGSFTHNVGFDWGLVSNAAGWPAAVQWEGRSSGAIDFSDNILAFKAGQHGVCVRNEGNGLAGVTYKRNKYFTANPLGGYGQFQTAAGSAATWPQWQAAAGEQGSVFAVQPDVDVSVAAFLNEHGFPTGINALDAYMTEARKQSKANWRETFTAKFYVQWAQAKFGVAQPPTP